MARSVVGLGAVAVSAICLPLACLFPEYSFNEGTADGGSGPGGPGGGPGSGGAGAGSMSSANGANGGGGSGATGAEGGGGSGGSAEGGGGAGGVTTSSGMGGMMSSSSSSSGMGGSGGGCMGGNEDCDNGLDDDCDGDADCADSDCTAIVSCVDNVPAGWTGHYSLYDGQIMGAPGCGGAYPNQFYVGNGQLMAPAATCSACTCGSPTGEMCLGNTMTVLDATLNNCVGQAYCGGQLAIGAPNNLCFFDNTYVPGGDVTCGPNSNGCISGTQPCNQSLIADAATVIGGSCPASSQMPTVPPATWGKLGRACGGAVTTAAGCGGGQKCMPLTGAPFESGVCISKVGTNACPAGSFTEQHIFFASFSDTRTCTGCSCSSPSGSTCSITIEAYSTSNCTAGSLVGSVDGGSCSNLVGNPEVQGRKTKIKDPISGGSCTSSGGQPTGVATGTTPVTFCCIP